MSVIPFDTLKLAQSLQDRIATKDDLELLEQRLTIKIGGMFVVAIGALAGIIKLMGH